MPESWMESARRTIASRFSLVFTEDPSKLAKFRDVIGDLSWGQASTAQSLNAIFNAVDHLAEAEVRYYFRRRRTRAFLSGIFRTLAWIAGSIGILLPLLAATGHQNYSTWAPWGYVFLASAASFLGANALFGGTSGHVRFVSVQLSLEHLMTKARIEWCGYLMKVTDSPPNASHKEGFDLIGAYVEAVYAATIAETGQWGFSVMEELSKYSQALDRQRQESGAAVPVRGRQSQGITGRANENSGRLGADNTPRDDNG